MWALSTASSRVAGPGRTAVALLGRAPATRSRSTCSWSKVTTAQRSAQCAEIGLDQRATRRRPRRRPRRRRRRVAGPARPWTGRARLPPRRPSAPAAPLPRTRFVGAQLARPRPGDSHRQWGRTHRGTLGEEHRLTMAKPLRIGTLIDVDQPLARDRVAAAALRGGRVRPRLRLADLRPRRLTLLAAAGSQVPGIGLGTGVVPVYPRHPMMLAQQALTVQAATDDRLLLGIGLSHQVVVEGMWGMSFDKPASYMRSTWPPLMPLLRGETPSSTGERVTTNAFPPLDVPRHDRAARPGRRAGSRHVELAGTVADGTITWMTGTATIGSHIAPRIRGRGRGGGPARAPRRRVPAGRGDDRRRCGEGAHRQEFSIYPNLPSYKAMLDKEGAAGAADDRLRRRRGDGGRLHPQAGRRRRDRLRRRGRRGHGPARPRLCAPERAGRS